METRRLLSRIGFGYVLFFLADVAFQFLFVIILIVMAGLIPGFEVSTSVLTYVAQLARYGCALPLMWLWLRRIPSWQKSEPEKLSAGTFMLVLIFCFGLTYIGNIIGNILMEVTSAVTGVPIDNPVDTMLKELGLLNIFINTVIVAPLMEELLFRKLLIDRMIPYGNKAAVIISGVAFGLYHGNFYQFFYACMIGMVFAYLYCLTGTVWYGITIHGIINFVGGFLSSIMFVYLDEGSLVVKLYSALMGCFMLAVIIVAIVFICVFNRKVKWFPGWADRPEKGFWRTCLTAPGILAFFGVCIIMFFL